MINEEKIRQILIDDATRIFATEKPGHFTDYLHCEECADHDETLCNSDIERIGLAELGNPGWDPICFCSAEGVKYYLPALVRLSLDTVKDDFYFWQFLFHLEYDGADNKLIKNCSREQRTFITTFLQFMIEQYTEEIEESFCTDDALRTYELWSGS